MNDKEKAAVDRLKAMDSVVIEQFDPDNAIWCDIRLVLTALQSATERADRAEAVLRVYADGKNWKSPKGSMAFAYMQVHQSPDNSTKSTPIKTNVNRCEPWTHVWVKSPELPVSCDVCGISISEAVDK